MSEQYTRYVVIMAGGSGERFWPMSRQARPKQLLPLGPEGKTLLQEAVEHAAALAPVERILIATGEGLCDAIRQAMPAFPADNVIGEPARRNTAGCLVYATARVLARHDDSLPPPVLAVLTADHVMTPAPRVRATLERAFSAAQETQALVVLGLTPTRAESGFGYIEVGEDAPVAPVARFCEKPQADIAEEFLRSGRHYWNSGMFFWRVSTFMEELASAQPALAVAVHEMTRALRDGDQSHAQIVFEALESHSIDHALMERARRVVMLRADFQWDDIGAWTALERVGPCDAQGNVTTGDPVLIDVGGSVVRNGPGAERMAVAVMGLDDVIVVVEQDAVLVLPKSRAQDVRRVVEALRARNATQL